ncbi:hypothetical protein SAMN02745121_00042 [Nannocystis exedens]|uniref:Uncharacterized protein n=1 Tax=Nannocystis exedens TaxID=54 RepID=A0A1I1SHM0_9BACT|nr:hypothetical protein [Nannocystis exedens]PCC75502.1 hypothetical protein NAEX_08613 [Nannocystis exedens]SFD45974.1 hypothetical protein SAMN02745121_00042 [Nannocystis exedens]
MATWILFLHLLFPTAPEAGATSHDDEAGLRYRGLEQMFARFDAEAAQADER